MVFYNGADVKAGTWLIFSGPKQALVVNSGENFIYRSSSTDNQKTSALVQSSVKIFLDFRWFGGGKDFGLFGLACRMSQFKSVIRGDHKIRLVSRLLFDLLIKSHQVLKRRTTAEETRIGFNQVAPIESRECFCRLK